MNVLPVLRSGLVEWMLGRRDQPTLRVALRSTASSDGSDDCVSSEYWTIDEVLYALWDDSETVPDSIVGRLGLHGALSFGQLARLLQVARGHAGPDKTVAVAPAHHD